MASAIHSVDLAAQDNVPGVVPSWLQRQALSVWRWLWGWVVTLWTAWRIYKFRRRVDRETIDPNEKCPACGHRKGKIRWEPELVWPDHTKGAVLHTCEVCSAVRAEKPIFKAVEWDIKIVGNQQGDATPFVHRPVPPSNPRSFQ